MNVDSAELLVLRLPLQRPFVTAHGSTAARDVLVVHVECDGVEGWGECGAATDPSYWPETVASAQASIPHIARGGAVPGQPMASAAWEMAVLDATLRRDGRSLAAHLGATKTHVASTATAGFDDDVEEFLHAGYRSIKLKVTPTRPPDLTACRDRGATVQVDANGSFASRPTSVRALDDLGLLGIEQPLGRDDLAGHAALHRELRTAVCLDESISSLDALDAALAAQAARAIVVKPARLGGLAAARSAHDRCVDAGVDAKVGGLLETGIGRAAALAVAALPGFTWPADLSASDRYWSEDLTEPFELDGNGCLRVPDGPGLGVTVRRDVLARHTVWSERLELDGRQRSATDDESSERT